MEDVCVAIETSLRITIICLLNYINQRLINFLLFRSLALNFMYNLYQLFSLL